jgi:hypothetical protein
MERCPRIRSTDKPWILPPMRPVLSVVVLVFALSGCGPETPPSPKPPPFTLAGGIARLDAGSGHYVWVASTEDDWDAMFDAEDVATRGGEESWEPLRKLLVSDRIFACSSGTRVRVEGISITDRPIRLVRILGGDSKDKTGWVKVESLRKLE